MSHEPQAIQSKGRTCEDAGKDAGRADQPCESEGGVGGAASPKQHGNSTHGLTKSAEYKTWQKMKERCYNVRAVNFERYGARGITVCSEWLNSFPQFLADMGRKPTPDHSIERADNLAGYSKENCSWATRKAQCRNRRSSRTLTVGDVTKTIAEWAEQTGIGRSTIEFRLNEGWEAKRAVETPADYGNRWSGIPADERTRFAKEARASKNHPHPTKRPA